MPYFIEQAPHNPHQFKQAVNLFRLFGLMFCVMATTFLCMAFVFYRPLLTPYTSQFQSNIDTVTSSSFLTVNCSSTIQTNNEVTINIQIKNISQVTLYLFDSDRMPYLIQQEDDSLLILYGITSPDPTSSYFDVLIPTTKPIQPNQVIKDQISLTPLYLGDHYNPPQFQNKPQQHYGPTTVHCQVGWGHTSILSHAQEKEMYTIYQLLNWQQLTKARPIEVDFPVSN